MLLVKCLGISLKLLVWEHLHIRIVSKFRELSSDGPTVIVTSAYNVEGILLREGVGLSAFSRILIKIESEQSHFLEDLPFYLYLTLRFREIQRTELSSAISCYVCTLIRIFLKFPEISLCTPTKYILVGKKEHNGGLMRYARSRVVHCTLYY